MKRVLFVRHGQGAHNLPSNDKQTPDPPLNPTGTAQVTATRSALLADDGDGFGGIELVVSSPLRRAVQTTLLLFPTTPGEKPPPPVYITPLVTERWDDPCDGGLPKSELAAGHPQVVGWEGWGELPEQWSATAPDKEVPAPPHNGGNCPALPPFSRLIFGGVFALFGAGVPCPCAGAARLAAQPAGALHRRRGPRPAAAAGYRGAAGEWRGAVVQAGGGRRLCGGGTRALT